MTTRKLQRVISAGFFIFWLVVLYAGADHPPPPGFIVVIITNLACSVVVYYRVREYANWLKSQKTKRMIRVIADGLAAGALISLIFILLPGGGEPSIPSPGLTVHIIWVTTLSFVGAVNAAIVYGITALITKKMGK